MKKGKNENIREINEGNIERLTVGNWCVIKKKAMEEIKWSSNLNVTAD